MGNARSDRVVMTFAGGEVNPLLDGRTDVEKVTDGCRTLLNMTIDEAGAAVRRRGFRYVASQKGFEPATGWYLVGTAYAVAGEEAADEMVEAWTLVEE